MGLLFETQKNKGERFEGQIAGRLLSVPGYGKVLRNLYFTKSNGETSETDVIFVHNSGIYVIEAKNYSGWIFGSEKNTYWTQSLRGARKNRFYNPLMQNEAHAEYMRRFMREKLPHLRSTIYSFVVFSDDSSFKDVTLKYASRNTLMHFSELYRNVSGEFARYGNVYSDSEVDEIFEALKPLTQVSSEVKAAHIENIRRKHGTGAERPAVQAPKTPECTEGSGGGKRGLRIVAAVLAVLVLILAGAVIKQKKAGKQAAAPGTGGQYQRAAAKAESRVVIDPGGKQYAYALFKNTLSDPAYVELVRKGATVMSFYIKGGGEFTSSVPAGTYSVRISTGKQWQSIEKPFGDGTKTSSAEIVYTFDQNAQYIVITKDIF